MPGMLDDVTGQLRSSDASSRTDVIFHWPPKVQYVPGKMMHHFSWFQHFLRPIHHFTGASFLCVTMLFFGSPSFYRNTILLEQLCPPNLSPPFYNSTFKNFRSVHHCAKRLLRSPGPPGASVRPAAPHAGVRPIQQMSKKWTAWNGFKGQSRYRYTPSAETKTTVFYVRRYSHVI